MFIFLYRKPRDTYVPPGVEIVYIAGAFPLLQRFNILPECAASHQAEIEPAKLAAFISMLFWARSSAKSLFGPLLLKETKASLLGGVTQEYSVFSTECYQTTTGGWLWMAVDKISIEAWMVCSVNTSRLNMSLFLSHALWETVSGWSNKNERTNPLIEYNVTILKASFIIRKLNKMNQQLIY